MSKIIDKVKELVNSFHCEVCGKKCNDQDVAKYYIYVEKWFEKDAKSSTEVKLCSDCAAPIVAVVKRAKVLAALRKKDKELDPNDINKPYHFDN